jgi:hypothetical protein
MNSLIDYLRTYVQSGNLIGFCPWEDGEGMLWGRILSMNPKGFRLQNVGPLGEDEEVEDYLFSEILHFSVDEKYANRLVLLAQFKPTLPETYENITDKDEIRNILEVASKSGEVIRIDNPNDENISATVKAIDGDWVEYLFYADPMVAGGTQWMKIEFIVSVSWRNARTEADEYLLKLGT